MLKIISRMFVKPKKISKRISYKKKCIIFTVNATVAKHLNRIHVIFTDVNHQY